jgi:hypothetical protein
MTGRPEFDSRWRHDYSLAINVQVGFRALPVFYTRDTGVLPLEVKRPGSEADHSPPSSAEVKKMQRCIHSSYRSILMA